MKNGKVTVGHPHHGIQKLTIKQVENQIGDTRTAQTSSHHPTSRFGWVGLHRY